MLRCLQLAELGAGKVAPNPMVGAVLVHKNKIIGEGYHAYFGGNHAEVNCLENVKPEKKKLIAESTLYVSLEPCAHVGKTPACANFIVQQKIKKVVIGCADSFSKVNGAGIQILQQSGVEVELGILEKQCRILNKYFFTFHEKQRPYITLKWAQTNNGFIAEIDKALKITNDTCDLLSHKWRNNNSAILVGTKTVLVDNPSLTTRNWVGVNPTRIIIDLNLQLHSQLNIFNGNEKVIVVNVTKQANIKNIFYEKINTNKTLVQNITEICKVHQLNSVLVEGGAKTLQLFINENMWDEANICTNQSLTLNTGIASPQLEQKKLVHTFQINEVRLSQFKNEHNEFL
jgi:diaminohydroxyphosphoribosylaminopyrimidine deaminase / 5-amino-6-(5-phosphoribosylamino)uracil reductase